MTSPPRIEPAPGPSAAWRLALGYFASCWVAAWGGGTLAFVVAWPWMPRDGRSAVFTASVLLVAFVGYWIIWPRGTDNHGRRLFLVPTVVFGVTWGASEGLLFATIWLVFFERLGPGPGTVVLSVIVLATYNAAWHTLVWDRKVAPPHNIESWNVRKIAFVHAPVLTLAVIHLTAIRSVPLFVAVQIVALVGSAVFMRLPPPGWSDVFRGSLRSREKVGSDSGTGYR